MVLEKIIAGIIAILIIWVMVPHIKRGEFIAPNPIAPNTWMGDFAAQHGQAALATPPEGYGFRQFDFWNGSSNSGRPATREDFQLRY